MRDSWRGYLQIAADMIETAGQQAASAVRTAVDQSGVGGDVSEGVRQQLQNVPDELQRPVQQLAEDLLAASRANRDLMMHVMRTEAEKVVTQLGERLGAELDRVQEVLQKVEQRLDSLEARIEGLSGEVGDGRGAFDTGGRKPEPDDKAPAVDSQPVSAAAPAVHQPLGGADS
jgi:chromosome segregation ATPase